MRVTHTVTVRGDACVVRIFGDIDMASSDALDTWLRAAVDDTGCRAVEVDLSQTAFLDSMGIRGLVRAQQYATGRGVAMRCVNVQPWVRRVFEIAGVAGYLGLGEADAGGR
ncbi:STAS domain-containing protein [Catellatospora sp. NPDC049609]|uniref:STAS domain-containing protein n=1 Tax=Catellatospora sp. NPDC049609 TaxID=3155505 RepID=UPI00341A5318